MIVATGDNKLTTKAVLEAIGINDGLFIEGPEL